MAKAKTARLDLGGQSAASIVESLNSKYGAGTLILASDAEGAKIEFQSTGIHAIDYGLGGGLPKNRITEIRGPFSSGKSTVSLSAIAQVHADDPDALAAYIDLEKTFDPAYAAILGCDLTRIILVNPDSGEQAADLVNDLLGISVGIIIVLDSLAAMVPTSEIEASADQQMMGTQARLVNRAFRVANARMKRSLYDSSAPWTILLVLNQLREKIGVMFGNPETTPGGKGKDFFYSVMFRISAPPSKRIMRDIERNGQKRKIMCGMVHEISINKNKCGASQFDEADFEYFVKPHKHYKPFSFNNDEVTFKMGLFYDVIKPITGAKGKVLKHVCPNGKELSANEAHAIKQLYALPKTLRLIHKKIVKAIRSGIEEDDDDEGSSVKVVAKKKK